MFRLSPQQGFSILAIISTILVYLSYQVEKEKPVKHGVEPGAFVLALRWAHYFCLLFACFYCILFDHTFDALFLLFVFGMYTHWLIFRGECILSYLETKYYHPDYVMGDHLSNNIYLKLIFGSLTGNLMIIFGILSVINFMVVQKRQYHIPEEANHAICILIAVYVIGIGLYKLEKIKTRREPFTITSLHL